MRNYLYTVFLIIPLASCGGGGGGSAASITPPNTVSGVAATGAPLVNALITLQDSLGNKITTTTDTSGNYSLNTSTLTPPFVLLASGSIGDAQTALVSVLPSGSSYSASTTVNINPLTHAIASNLSSNNDPLSLVNNLSANISNITSKNVSSATSYLNQSLSSIAVAAGASGTFNPISDSFTANGSGLDKLLDNITNTTQPGTGSVIFVKDGATVDDMAGSNTAPSISTSALSTASLTLNNSTTTSTPSTVANTLTPRDYTVANSITSLLNACFAITNANGRSSNAACSSPILATPDYLNGGNTLANDLSSFMSSTYDGATFNNPEIIRFYSPTRAYVKISGTTTTGVSFSFYSVVARVTVSGGASTESTSGTWQLRGDQRSIFLRINAEAMRQVEWNPNAPVPSGYYSGITPTINLNSTAMQTAFAVSGGSSASNGSCTGSASCSYVLISGPGIPIPGLIYKRNTFNAGCGLALVPSFTTVVSPSTGCTTLFKMNGIPVNAANMATFASAFQNTNGMAITIGTGTTNTYTTGQSVSGAYSTQTVAAIDAIITAIPAYAPYTFQIYDGTSGTSTFYTVRLRGRPPTTGELANYQWVNLTTATSNLMQPACIVGSSASFAGGSSIPVAWTQTTTTLPVYGTYVQFTNQANQGNLLSVGSSFAPVNTVGTVTQTINATSGHTFPSAPIPTSDPTLGSGTTGGRSWIGTDGRSADDTIVYSANSFSYGTSATCTQ